MQVFINLTQTHRCCVVVLDTRPSLIIPLTIAVLMGTLLGLFGPLPLWWWSVVGVGVACASLMSGSAAPRLPILAIVAMCTSAAWAQLRSQPTHHDHGQLVSLEGRFIIARVVVDRWPWGTINAVADAQGGQLDFTGTVHLGGHPFDSGTILQGPGLVTRTKKGSLHLRMGGYASVVRRPQMSVIGTLKKAAVHRLADDPSPSSKRLALIEASVLGRRSVTFRRLYTPFRDTGTAHLLAVSGLHLALVASMGLALRRLVGASPGMDAVVLVLTAVLFLLLVDIRPPLARAVAMALVIALGPPLHRRLAGGTALAFALLVALILDPRVVTHPGPQLSFTVVAALVWVLPVVEARARLELRPMGSWRRAWRAGWLAWLVSTPIIMVHFGRAGPFAVPAGIAMVPMLTVLLGAGWIRVLTPPSPFDVLSGMCMDTSAGLMLWGADTLASIPGAAWIGPRPQGWWAVLAECVIFVAYLRPGAWVWFGGGVVVVLLCVV